LGILDKLRVSSREPVIDVVLAVVIAFILPPVGFMLLFLALFGLLMIIFRPKNVMNLVIAWLAARSAERIADKFSRA